MPQTTHTQTRRVRAAPNSWAPDGAPHIFVSRGWRIARLVPGPTGPPDRRNTRTRRGPQNGLFDSFLTGAPATCVGRRLSVREGPRVSANGSRRPCEVAVVGAGQAGLAIGYFLARQGRRFVILDARRCDRFGLAESLGLARPCSRRAATTACPGCRFPGDPMAIRAATRWSPIWSGMRRPSICRSSSAARARSLTRRDGGFVVELDDGAYGGRSGGGRHRPVPRAAGAAIAGGVSVRRSSSSTAPATAAEDVPGEVLVVGGGNTGYQIAEELAGIRMRCISPIGRGRRPCLSGSSAATCSGA